MNSADYQAFSDAEKVAYLEKRLAHVNRVNQSLSDTMRSVAGTLALQAVKMDAAIEKAAVVGAVESS